MADIDRPASGRGEFGHAILDGQQPDGDNCLAGARWRGGNGLIRVVATAAADLLPYRFGGGFESRQQNFVLDVGRDADFQPDQERAGGFEVEFLVGHVPNLVARIDHAALDAGLGGFVLDPCDDLPERAVRSSGARSAGPMTRPIAESPGSGNDLQCCRRPGRACGQRIDHRVPIACEDRVAGTFFRRESHVRNKCPSPIHPGRWRAIHVRCGTSCLPVSGSPR